jgi:hypothetical protein
MNSSNIYESYLGIYDLSEGDPKDHPDIRDQRDFANRASKEMERRRHPRANAKRAKIESGIKGPSPHYSMPTSHLVLDSKSKIIMI